MLSLTEKKSALAAQVERYIGLLSSLRNPSFELVEDLEYFKGLVQFANTDEIDDLKRLFDGMAPADNRAIRIIEGRSFVGATEVAKAMLVLRGWPTSLNSSK